MIIHSPVGRFPYEIAGVRYRDGRIIIDGAMGTWPTVVELAPSELPRLMCRALGVPGLAVLGAGALAVLAACRSRR